MASINDLIQQIENLELRNRIQAEVKKLAKQKKFGLVFEEHLPECTPLYDVPVTVGKNVSLKDGKANEIYKVVDVINNEVTCIKNGVKEQFKFDINRVVVTAVFGEPIYPYLKPIDSVCNAPDSELWHTLIEADNYHALQLLEYLYSGKVDCIYIDPPYNTGAKDWKYNNNYVDSNDEYRHSKWLSFMKKRLLLAKKLLNPTNSVLIVTIDEKEYLHLGCLLEEIFPDNDGDINNNFEGRCKTQMVSSRINYTATARKNQFDRVNEFIFYVMLGNYTIYPLDESKNFKQYEEVNWRSLRRQNSSNIRDEQHPNQFFPIYVNTETNTIVDVGECLPMGVSVDTVKNIDGCETVWPIRENGKEMMWGLKRDTFLYRLSQGYVRVGKHNPEKPQKYVLKFLEKGILEGLNDGSVKIIGKRSDGSVIAVYDSQRMVMPKTQWEYKLHDSREYGTYILNNIFREIEFAYPKSLYAVEHCLKLFLMNRPNALVIDFFAGSGTTLHAINLLNLEDNGSRRCIMITNNEVSEKETDILINNKVNPGDNEWEKLGVARSVTWPRTKCSILGVNINGETLKGRYFTSLKNKVDNSRKINQIALNSSLLSLKAKKSIIGLMGKNILPQSILKEDTHYIVSEKYTTSIIFNLEYVDEWLAELEENTQITDIYIVTDNDKAFKNLKTEVTEVLGSVVTEELLTIPMSEGFKANVEYFKLGFLDKTMVKIGRQFKELLPILWMKSGSVGARPIIEGDSIPDMLVLPKNKMAILVDDNKFYDFKEQISEYPEIEYVYIVTNYEQGYRSKIAQLEVPYTYQLYRDYLDNFRINYRRANQ